jgi:hypothetical protein
LHRFVTRTGAKGLASATNSFFGKKKKPPFKGEKTKRREDKKYGIIAKEILEKTASWLDKMQH